MLPKIESFYLECAVGSYHIAVYNDAAQATEALAMDMIDPFGRTISYLRVSVTDRCDFRCT
ncbi:MAG: hypothetical protein E5X94_07905, partial [Mesorhizobium sp.]